MVLQELGYMARRGHRHGVLSMYHHFWFLKTDGQGTVWISDAIAAGASGNAGRVSVKEVCRPPTVLTLYC